LIPADDHQSTLETTIAAVTQTEIETALLRLIAKQHLPFSFTSTDEFKEFWECVMRGHPIYSKADAIHPPPDRHTITDKLHKIESRLKDSIQKQFSITHTAASLTTDAWTSLSRHHFIGVCAHFVTPNWQLQRRCLGIFEINEGSDHAIITATMRSVLDEYKLAPISVTVDQGSNFVKSIDSDLRLQRVVCVCHNVNLSINDVIDDPDVKGILDRVRACVAVFAKSPKRLALLATACKAHSIKPLRPKRDNITRWTSTYNMCSRAIVLKDAFADVFAELGAAIDQASVRITSAQWALLKEMCSVLWPASVWSIKWQGATYITGAVVAYQYKYLIAQTQDVKDISDPKAVSLRDALVQRLIARDTYSANEFLHFAAVLHPALKTLWWVTDAFRATIYTKLKAEFDALNIASMPPVAAAPPPAVPPPAALAARRVGPAAAALAQPPIMPAIPENSKSDWDRYIDITITPPERYETNFRAEEWWSRNESKFPILAVIARKYLSVQGSAAEPERIWSAAGRLVNQRRCSLHPDQIATAMFVSLNWD